MAKKKIREYDGKKLLVKHINRFTTLDFSHFVKPVLVTKETIEREWLKLIADNPWLLETKLVAKPDMLFGKRGKYGLVKVNATIDEAKQFIAENIDKTFTIGKTIGNLTHWIIEPFVPHNVEFYFSIISEREETIVYFSPAGGVEVESNWDKIKVLKVPIGDTPKDFSLEVLSDFYAGVPDDLRESTEQYVNGMFSLFEDLDFVTLETNPFTLVKVNDNNEEKWSSVPLDLCAELDDTALFKQTRKWGDLNFPEVFGRKLAEEERQIQALDEKTGASLKLSILKRAPGGRIWNLVAGGGASVIFADTVVDLGYGHLLGNYGEYSGGPNAEQTYEYTKNVLKLATENPDGQGRVLLIGGGIANFTDVAKTFKGIVHALKEYKSKLQESKMRIYVRRAGPNYKTGLALMKSTGKELGIPIEVFGPEIPMTNIIPLAIQYIQETTVDS